MSEKLGPSPQQQMDAFEADHLGVGHVISQSNEFVGEPQDSGPVTWRDRLSILTCSCGASIRVTIAVAISWSGKPAKANPDLYLNDV